MTKKQKESLLSAFNKIYFDSALNTTQDHRLVGAMIVGFCHGAEISLPDNFGGYEEERKMLADIVERAKRNLG